jgi:hypothetical protein
MNIYQKLIEVRKAVPYLKKDNTGHQFKYVSSSQALGTLKQKMDEMGLLLVPSVCGETVSDHTTKKGDHEYFTEIKLRYTWVNAETPEETVVCDWYGQGLDNGEKGVGKAMTYAEKYFLLKFFNIATDNDDPDSFQRKIDDQKPSACITESQVNTISAFIDENGIDKAKFLSWAKIKSLSDITENNYDNVINT